MDVSGAATAPGTIVISYGCKNAGVQNQQWMFAAVSGTSNFTITPRNTQGLRVDNQSSASTGGGIIVDTAVTATPTTSKDQQWQLQQVSTGVYEFVSVYSGLCLTSPNGSTQNLGQMSQTPCNGSQYQQFLISQTLENVGCTLGTSSFKWTWNSVTTGPYHVVVTGNSGTNDVFSTAATATGATVNFSTLYAYGYGNYTVNFVDANGTVVATGTASVNTNKANNSCTISDMQ